MHAGPADDYTSQPQMQLAVGFSIFGASSDHGSYQFSLSCGSPSSTGISETFCPLLLLAEIRSSRPHTYPAGTGNAAIHRTIASNTPRVK